MNNSTTLKTTTSVVVVSNCKKFEANIFNKLKCQNCFKSKEEHSASALENTKNARKVVMYSYLFVAPNSFDFNSPLDRTKRWQRRLFVLYDDGELTYSVDENCYDKISAKIICLQYCNQFGTVPQGVIDMNKCKELKYAEQITTHRHSMLIVADDNSKTYIKGSCQEEFDSNNDDCIDDENYINCKIYKWTFCFCKFVLFLSF
ncbi:hypothetical protein HELRODRAFT_175182 [Helobdella robusta]|uniref:PH domain-containing protein n=1 Tax=Helobdella robusta TaxID=6412 RepID=T1F8Z0_HELRO|nr:hypothetical protein HELRODRAFT_175182 [Helobdella robusta]ESO01152.1 hypothetical protein HELRODRAFT_175182 [Helobdella robusta]